MSAERRHDSQDEWVKCTVNYGSVKIRTEPREDPRDPWAIQYWGWAEHYDRRGRLIKRTEPEMISRIVMV